MKLIVNIQTAILLIQSCLAQFLQEISHEHSHHRSYPEVHNDRYQNHYEIYNGPSYYPRYNLNSDEADNCKCSCQNCDYKPKPCCKRICNQCRIQRQPASFQPAPSSLVMIPYPVPFFVYPIKDTTQSNQTKTKSGETSTANPTPKTESTKPIVLTDDEVSKEFEYFVMTSSTKYFEDPGPIKQHLKMDFDSGIQNLKGIRDKNHRNVRPRDTNTKTIRRLPKYGLIPIPNDMADELMSQLNQRALVQ